VKSKLLPQVLQLLIDETLLEQEATRMGVTVQENEMQEAMASLAVKNNIPVDALPDFFEEKGISERAVRAQVHAQILRVRIIGRTIRPQVAVTDQEVEEKMENIASQTGKEEYHLSEILLPVDTAEDEEKIKRLADKLYEELKKGRDFA